MTSRPADSRAFDTTSKQFFVHPDLIAPLANLGPLTSGQVDELRKLKGQFDTELAKPPLDRTVSIYNDELYRRALEATLAHVAPAGR